MNGRRRRNQVGNEIVSEPKRMTMKKKKLNGRERRRRVRERNKKRMKIKGKHG